MQPLLSMKPRVDSTDHSSAGSRRASPTRGGAPAVFVGIIFYKQCEFPHERHHRRLFAGALPPNDPRGSLLPHFVFAKMPAPPGVLRHAC